MAKLSKKKINAINRVSHYYDMVKEQDEGRYVGESHWLDTHPDMWSPEETKLFSLLTELEDKIKKSILELI